MKRILSFLLAILLWLNPVLQTAFAQTLVPGQVNDDTDIFLINPNVPNERPNVLIVWDTTANWGQNVAGSTAFALEKQALQDVITGLSEQFNVGLMLFTETGGGNSNVRGTYPRYHFQQMTAANKTAINTIVNNLAQIGDRGSNAQYARAMHEAYLYFGGKTAMAGAGQVKRDGNAFVGGYCASCTQYVSPVGGACQKNYIIFIGNGPTDNGENNSAEALLTGLGGKLPTDPIQLDPDQEEANWADEYARFVGNNDVNAMTGTQNITVFTLAVYDQARENQRATASYISLLKSMARQGNGEYYAGVDLQSIIDGLTNAFKRIEADDSVFTSTTLPVSVNVRGTQLNQVYMGVFRPDASMNPRWYGNLKMYKLGLDTSTSPPSVFLADSGGARADNASSGFINPDAVSHWTTSSTFWAWRDPTLNGAGGSSDSPDGDKVEKGAVAQQLRVTYATSQDGRNLYTCTGTCTTNSSLSGTPFNTTNADITQADLGVADSTARDTLIRWIRGQDNAVDENTDGSTTDVRASIHGDVLHSRPALINYNRNSPSDDNDVIAFYGANDGVFRAIQGGLGNSGGTELWGFIPSELFGRFKRLRDNSPAIDINNKRPYFMDGPIGVYQKDVNDDGKLVAADGDKVYLYIGMRRGGRFIYALDVSDPSAPKMLWKKSNTDTGFAELGYTWSEPKVALIRAHANPVLIMAAGYDPNQDNDPVSLGTDTMGRGVMVLDALTGELLWQVGPSPTGASQGNLTEAGMTSSMPSDVTILDRNGDGYIDRVYVGDTGANVWRVDIHSDQFADWSAVKLASVGSSADADRRKFMYPPDVVFSKDANGPYDAVLLGSGDREHPFNTTVVNRYYMFKDRVTDLISSQSPAITETDLFDATTNTIQDGANETARVTARGELTAADGWMMTLGTGEKVVGGSTTLAGTTFFNTNQPAPANSTVCSAQGIALQYAISYEDATATIDSGQAGLNISDRAISYAGGGYLPSPVPVVVNLGGRLYQAVISGPQVRMPPQAQLESRFRTYWYITND